MATVYKGTDAANKLAASDVFPYSETIQMFGYGGHDELKGAFLHPNLIYGGLGNDTITGGAAGNVLYGGGGNDSIECWQGEYAELFGGPGNDHLRGGDAGNLLDGGAGNDTMQGGDGADVYCVDSRYDVIVESYQPYYDNDPNPRDSVRSTVSYTLGSNLEALTLVGSVAIDGRGNALSNTLVGNRASNVLNGGAGRDILDGGAGMDTADYSDRTTAVSIVLNGATNATATVGGKAEDILRNIERINGGSAADRLGGDGLGNALVGNAGNDVLTGGAGADRLDGGAGSDYLDGGAGADTLVLHAAVGISSDSGRAVLPGSNNDRGRDTLASFSLTEDTIQVVATGVTRFAHGSDTAIGAGTGTDVAGGRASFSTATGLVELNQANNSNWADAGDLAVTFVAPGLTLTEARFEARLQYILGGTAAADSLGGGPLDDALHGGSGNDVLRGGGGADRLYGDAGSDLLRGGSGSDTLSGGTGRDVFRFDAALGTAARPGIDRIQDFSAFDDTIQLENSVFTRFGRSATGAIASANFKAIVTGGATDINDYVVFNKSTGVVYYDANGSTNGLADAVAFASLTVVGTNPVTSADFVLV